MYVTRTPLVESRHCFSFGAHYDAANTHHGPLVACNDERVRPGGGFPLHGHRGLEIVTWVLDGELEHRDSLGNVVVLRPGQVQRITAGTGVRHSETNARADADLRFVQSWVLPDAPPVEPSYDVLDAGEPGLRPVIAVRRDTTLWAGRLGAGEVADVPEGAYVHVYVARGTAELDGVPVESARLASSGPRALTATADADVLVWVTA